MHWADQKYKPEEQIRVEFPKIQREFIEGNFLRNLISGNRWALLLA